MNSFTRSIDLLQREMDVAQLRYNVGANNIAMSEVPNYKRQVVTFESELKRPSNQKKILKTHLNLLQQIVNIFRLMNLMITVK